MADITLAKILEIYVFASYKGPKYTGRNDTLAPHPSTPQTKSRTI